MPLTHNRRTYSRSESRDSMKQTRKRSESNNDEEKRDQRKVSRSRSFSQRSEDQLSSSRNLKYA